MMNKVMNLIERLRFCLEATIFKKTDEQTLDILRKLQTDNTIVSIGKNPCPQLRHNSTDLFKCD